MSSRQQQAMVIFGAALVGAYMLGNVAKSQARALGLDAVQLAVLTAGVAQSCATPDAHPHGPARSPPGGQAKPFPWAPLGARFRMERARAAVAAAPGHPLLHRLAGALLADGTDPVRDT
ncbi:hypothetical protein [Kitasatospora purpeofusca]|uniref:hypothetical protein n=1 Tax=Kitasatospora purpeofusca TaxID=67352 RepID=UPI00224DB372|nr:hypothetical protein [Kitasatospora purpeofusca]MCX4755095.1 hypothetical protein [Kitasatospora purpeofusca]WSR29492.1 hypothetical protein OG715_00080 [Kitasatospora purpeofusca]WSR37007.1 hypothetical protein OG715_42270 [Kitasatospora purpeofusca]